MEDETPNNALKKSRQRRPHTIQPVPQVLNWREQIRALFEVSSVLAIALWRALRTVRLWADTEPEKRAILFHLPTRGTRESIGLACAEAPELVEAFGVFSLLLRTPAQVSHSQVAGACQQVYEWAEARSLILTAVHFAEAAAYTDAEDPALANAAGHICRRATLYERSAAWYQRGFGLAVRLKGRQETVSRQESIQALLGYGILMRIQGRYDEARRYHELAARRAVRTGRRQQAAKANHDLLSIAVEVGTYSKGKEYATKALDLYPILDPRLPYLAHDYASLLIRNRFYSLSLPLLSRLLQVISRPDEQILIHGNIARVAANSGQRDRFEESKCRVLQLSSMYQEYASAALIHIAEGARVFQKWDQAEQYAILALEIARNRKDSPVENDAQELLRQVGAHEQAPPEAEPPDREQIELLNRRFLARLRRWKAPDPKGFGADPEADGGLSASGGC